MHQRKFGDKCVHIAISPTNWVMEYSAAALKHQYSLNCWIVSWTLIHTPISVVNQGLIAQSALLFYCKVNRRRKFTKNICAKNMPGVES